MPQLTLLEAAQAALDNGREGVDVGDDHGFNIKKANVFWDGNVFVVKGQLSHRLKWRHDDQYHYTIRTTFYPPDVSWFEDVDFGGVTKIAGPILGSIVAAPFAAAPFPMNLLMAPFAEYVVEELASGLEANIAGLGWKEVAHSIAAMAYTLAIQPLRANPPERPAGYKDPLPHDSDDDSYGWRIVGGNRIEIHRK